MNDFISAGFAGFIFGICMSLSVSMWVIEGRDIQIQIIEAAITACRDANSTMVSTDYRHATCANRAVIPFEVKK